MQQLNTFSIFLGDNKTMNLKAIQFACGGNPLDLTYCTEINIALPNADGSISNRLLSLGQVIITQPSILGNFSCPIPSGISDLLNPGEYQNFDVTFTISAQVFTVRFYQALSVLEL